MGSMSAGVDNRRLAMIFWILLTVHCWLSLSGHVLIHDDSVEVGSSDTVFLLMARNTGMCVDRMLMFPVDYQMTVFASRYKVFHVLQPPGIRTLEDLS